MNRKYLAWICCLAGAAAAQEPDLIAPGRVLQTIARHDPVWEKAASTWNEGLLLGNGDLGVNVWGGGDPLIFSIDKADVWEIRHWDPPASFTWKNFRQLLDSGTMQGRDATWMRNWQRPREGGKDVRPYPTRVPIGRLELIPAGKARAATMRLNLTEATAHGEVQTEKGSLHWKCFVAATEPLIILEVDAAQGEAVPRFQLRDYTGEHPIPGAAHTMLTGVFGYPSSVWGQEDGVSYWVQPMPGSGEYAVAWRQESVSATRSRMYITIAFTPKRSGAKGEAVGNIRRAWAADAARLEEAHRRWWTDYYPASFLSIPDTRLEGLYWIEMYKLASATRPGKQPITLVGPWAQDAVMPAWQGDYHWDINVQMTYWPIYAANRLELGLPLYDMLDRCRPMMREFARKVMGTEGEFLLVSTGIDCVPHYGWADGQLAAEALPWAAHHYWLHWRYSQDKEFLKLRAVPLMKAALPPLLEELREGPDGKLHIRWGLSPEYAGSTKTFWGPDPTMDLTLLRFLLDALIEADDALAAKDPQRAEWERLRSNLAPFPTHPQEGLKVRADLRYEDSHRHHSHLSPVYPFHQVTMEKDAPLMERSLRRWILAGHGEWVGFSWAWAASIAAHAGRPSLARTLLLDYVDRFVTENTLMFQGAVAASDMTVWESGKYLTLESGFGAADAIQNMLLQSHGGVIRVFPASPPAWNSASFHRLRAEGAFLVSARRSAGRTTFVHVRSEKGGVARIRSAFGNGDVYVAGRGGPKNFRQVDSDIVVECRPGEEFYVWVGLKPEFVVRPDPGRRHEYNFFGVKTTPRW
jgi:hypothetical protein